MAILNHDRIRWLPGKVFCDVYNDPKEKGVMVSMLWACGPFCDLDKKLYDHIKEFPHHAPSKRRS